MRVYFDSSAFAKRYIDETGTVDVLAWCERASELALSVIAVPEVISAFCRLQREGRLTDAQYQIIKRALMLDIADALICDTTPQVLQHAVKVLENHTLRGMDAIHLGAALACTAEVFISADARQCRAAEAFSLQVVSL
ncbi:type II toxin-antitoxin system VapC family toxin [Acidithiobacillus sp. HP-6]|uniref:type II toxin-antitoxin system VapC family toxin n=1 Tax=unclassified Acidithiobacillus TaxID=2614800 RepID=UPI0018797A16|nr:MULTISPECIES: type II toxin-antitoxin system VapC family toxin [unclassified Acidithiobacillus]MBE7563903.1 type II toxin-antitoxin system VapC family toxin [Acidithiobacillus sp. HP-6]MBE7569061.1 type II toxin-antitoxin system VapC family toxin [Acidithiobacillus sp. HP-2]